MKDKKRQRNRGKVSIIARIVCMLLLAALITPLFSVVGNTADAAAIGWEMADGGGVNGLNADPESTATNLTTVTYNDSLYAAWNEDNHIRVKVYDGTTWNFVDNGGLFVVSALSVFQPSLAVYDSDLYVAWLEGSNTEFGDYIRVMKYDGLEWTSVEGDLRGAMNSTLFQTVRLVSNDNALYAVWRESESGVKIRAAQRVGNDWLIIDGGSGLQYGSYGFGSQYVNATIYNNDLYVTWMESNSSSIGQVRVKRYDGNNDGSHNWTFVDGGGTGGINVKPTEHGWVPILTADSNYLYAAWAEKNIIRVRQYNGTTWTTIDGGTGLNVDTNKTAYNTTYLHASDDELYVVWSEFNSKNSHQVRVKHYNGDNWVSYNGSDTAEVNDKPDTVTIAQSIIMYDGELYTFWREPTTNQVRAAKYIGLTYAIDSISDITLTGLSEGYTSGTQQSQIVMVTNKGTGNLNNVSVALSGDTTDFVITEPAATINYGASDSGFSVKAKDGLLVGTYTVEVTLSADQMTDVKFTVTQVVNVPGPPAIPTNLEATRGNQHVSLNWSTVTEATYYQVYMSTISGVYGDQIATVTEATYDVENLTNGTSYHFVVKSGNSFGLSEASNEVRATPATVPSIPTNVTATAGNGSATITFTAPIDNGGSAITGYEVTASEGDVVVTGAASPMNIPDLTNGTSYTFTVKAINGVDSSAPSLASNAVTPSVPTNNNDNNSSTPTQGTPSTPDPARTEVDILVNGKVESAGTATTEIVNGQQKTTIIVDEVKLQQRLDTEGQGAIITIAVTTDNDIVVGELNGRMVKNMEDQQAIVVIRTEQATYTLPAKQINMDRISKLMGEQLELQDINIRLEIAKPSADTIRVVENTARDGGFTIVVPPLNFTVHAVYGSETVEITAFNAYVERMIAIPDGVDPNQITTGVIIDPDGTVRHVPTKIVVIDGQYYAKINSLTNSTYSVVWHPKEFTDIANHWAREAINDMGSRMVIEGTGSGMFSPNRDVTRAEFAAIVIRGLGLKADSGVKRFSDVAISDWYSNAINAAYEHQLINGYPDGTFRPNDRITREQAMVIIAKAMNITGLNGTQPTAQESNATLRSYADGEAVSNWAKISVASNIQASIVSGRSSTELAPNGYMTRAEVAVIVQRLLQQSGLI